MSVSSKPSTQRVGLIVPSSNVTMEIEVPAMMRKSAGDVFSFHSSRMAMRQVSAAELKDMDAQAVRCASELSDARCEAMAYACLVAVMVQGPGAHREVERRLSNVVRERGLSSPVISSAGALVETVKRLGARKLAMVAPYMPTLTQAVVAYLEAEDISVASVRSLSVADNYEVGCIPGERVVAALREQDLSSVDAVILSACVQMPSLSILQSVQDELSIPVITAAACTSAAVLHALGRDPSGVPGGAGKAWLG